VTTAEEKDGTRAQTERAEEVMDDVSQRLDDWSDKVADWVARATARTREQVEDIWAEAQSLRRR
jgi:hypothetical protein